MYRKSYKTLQKKIRYLLYQLRQILAQAWMNKKNKQKYVVVFLLYTEQQQRRKIVTLHR